MFEVKTTLRTFYVHADHFNLATGIANALLVDGETILSVAHDGPATFIIVEIAA
jgi:hypothetical protein